MLETAARRNKLTDLQIKAVADIWGNLGEKSLSRISGFSMWPWIKPGDSLVIDHNLGVINLGDIVVFQYQDKLIAHRVVKCIKDETGQPAYLTKGDRNCQVDCLTVSRKTILAKVVQVNKANKEVNYLSPGWRLLNYLIGVYSYIKTRLLTV